MWLKWHEPQVGKVAFIWGLVKWREPRVGKVASVPTDNYNRMCVLMNTWVKQTEPIGENNNNG